MAKDDSTTKTNISHRWTQINTDDQRVFLCVALCRPCGSVVKKEHNMTKDDFLTVRWNNLLALGMGFIPLIYVVVAFSTSVWSVRGGLIGLAVIGVLY